MKVMILAAGFGKRMKPLTDNLPKPLLRVGGRSLLEWHLLNLGRAGFREAVINHHYLGHMIEDAIGDGSAFGMRLHYSPEARILETGGGIIKALPMLGEEAFVVVNADIWTDYDFAALPRALDGSRLGHLVMVPNAPHHPEGDFALDDRGLLRDSSDGPRFTFSGISVLSPALFEGRPVRRLALAELLKPAIREGRLGGELYQGRWQDVGTPQRLQRLDRQISGES